jgi:hypothetical protein
MSTRTAEKTAQLRASLEHYTARLATIEQMAADMNAFYRTLSVPFDAEILGLKAIVAELNSELEA